MPASHSELALDNKSRELSFSDSDMPKLDVQKLESNISNAGKEVRRISLRGLESLKKASWSRIPRILSSIPRHVTSLDIGHNSILELTCRKPHCGDYDINEIEILYSIPNSITDLNLQGVFHYSVAPDFFRVHSGAHDLFRVFTALPKNLHSLDFSENNVVEQENSGRKSWRERYDKVVDAFIELPRDIRILNLKGNKLGRLYPDMLGRLFSVLPLGITTLDISDNQLYLLNDKQLGEIFAKMPKTVTTLDLSERDEEIVEDDEKDKLSSLATLSPPNIRWLLINGTVIDLDRYRAESLVLQVTDKITNSGSEVPNFNEILFNGIDENSDRLINALKVRNEARSKLVIALLLEGRILDTKVKIETEIEVTTIEAVQAYLEALKGSPDPQLVDFIHFRLWNLKTIYAYDGSSYKKLKDLFKKISIPRPTKFIPTYNKFRLIDEKNQAEERRPDNGMLLLEENDDMRQAKNKILSEREEACRRLQLFEESDDIKPNEPGKIKEANCIRQLHQLCDAYQSHLLIQWRSVLDRGNYGYELHWGNRDITQNELEELPAGRNKENLKLIVGKYNEVQKLRKHLSEQHRNNDSTFLDQLNSMLERVRAPEFTSVLEVHRSSVALRFVTNLIFLVSTFLCGLGLMASYKNKGSACFWRSHGQIFTESIQEHIKSMRDQPIMEDYQPVILSA